jgi:hypothetical protein
MRKCSPSSHDKCVTGAAEKHGSRSKRRSDDRIASSRSYVDESEIVKEHQIEILELKIAERNKNELYGSRVDLN